MADIKTQKPLDDELRTVKVNNDSTPISVSKDKVKIDGQIVDTTHFTNIRVSGDITTDNGLRISTSDTETTDDITLDTGGRELFIKNGGEAVVNFSNGGGIVPSMIIYAWNGNTSDYLQISTTGNNGESKIETVDAAGSDADLTLDPDGDLLITPNTNVNINLASGGEFVLQENSGTYTPSADTHVATKKYIDDLVKYHYDIKTLGYYATATAIYLPLTGYILEQTSSTGRNEYMGYVAPYNGTLEKIVFRSEIAQDGNLRIVMNNASDGTEVPGSILGRKDVTVDIADDTVVEVDMTTGLTTGTNAITKGDIINIALTTPSNSNDTNVTVVFKWDVTT